MDVQLDDEVIARAVSEVVQKGITDGVGSYDVRLAIDDAVRRAVEGAELPRRIGERLDEVLADETAAIIETVLEGAAPALRDGMRFVIASALQSMLFGFLHGKPNSYDSDGKRLWEEAGRMLDPVAVPEPDESS